MKQNAITVAFFISLSVHARALGLRDAFSEIARSGLSSVECRNRLVIDCNRGIALRDVSFIMFPQRRCLWFTTAGMMPEEVESAIARIPLQHLVRIIENKRSSGLIFAESTSDSDKLTVLIILNDSNYGMTFAALATASSDTVDLLAAARLSLDCSTASLLTAASA